MNVKEFKAIIKDVPDDVEIVVMDQDSKGKYCGVRRVALSCNMYPEPEPMLLVFVY